ncbi:S8 family serine peptidase, partial [bacterium]|nr:S8 family serine peptidase [bacterium]
PLPAQEAGSSHGTHVAGLAAAKDNNGIGITGVMGRNVKIMALNVFGSTGGAGVAEMVNALNYARSKGAHVINMSLGGPGSADIVKTTLQNAVASGSFIAIAAGNDDALITDSNFYIPMGYAKDINGAVSVGSVDAITLQRSSFSNYSTTYVEIGAPGSDSTAPGGLLSTVPSNTYGYKQGTSMASPVVAGAAALLIGWAQSNGVILTPADVEAQLKSSADARGALSPYFMGGALLNLSNLAAATLCY